MQNPIIQLAHEKLLENCSSLCACAVFLQQFSNKNSIVSIWLTKGSAADAQNKNVQIIFIKSFTKQKCPNSMPVFSPCLSFVPNSVAVLQRFCVFGNRDRFCIELKLMDLEIF